MLIASLIHILLDRVDGVIIDMAGVWIGGGRDRRMLVGMECVSTGMVIGEGVPISSRVPGDLVGGGGGGGGGGEGVVFDSGGTVTVIVVSWRVEAWLIGGRESVIVVSWGVLNGNVGGSAGAKAQRERRMKRFILGVPLVVMVLV
jgi:hypothetical protein